MMKRDSEEAGSPRLQVLAEFRHELRQFLHFSEQAAQAAGLQTQQHQMLLQVAGAPAGVAATVAYAAERLGLRHNSAVELADRCEAAGLLRRGNNAEDRRSVTLRITPRGSRILDGLAADHARELNELAPRLIRALKHIQSSHAKTAGAGAAKSTSKRPAPRPGTHLGKPVGQHRSGS